MRSWLAALLAAVILAAAAYLYLSQGRVEVYVDPPAPGLEIYLTFTSVALHRVGNSSGWVVIFNGSRTVAIGNGSQLLASAWAPAGEYDEVFFTVSSATVEIGGVNVTARVPSGVFKVHITGGMRLSGGSTEKLLISIPHVAYADGQVIIGPSVTAQAAS
ncbi:MAG: hypothetical protein RXR02_07250 [Thermoproteus sp.]